MLDPDLIAKIAAGEVVERPASVLKELLENSIDAGATRIDINLQSGGIQEITVRDDGCGIIKEDLALALQQHATSKITQAMDLAAIDSLGFRGEALASVAAVAMLQITSNAADQPHAWTIINNKIKPAAHPIGTTVQMRELFYNIPARRKFLRSPRTEYQHTEEVFRRIALSRFDIGFSLRTNNKLLKNLPACHDPAAQLRRISKLCGMRKDLLAIDAEQNGLRLHGWISSATQARTQEAHQYFFINNRVIRDRLINHALRQVYQPLCADGTSPFYCLYLELDPVALDVNVHPTKHEVRFRDARIVHAFITEVLRETLHIAQPIDLNYEPPPAEDNLKILTILDNALVIAQHDQELLILDLRMAPKVSLKQLQRAQYRCYWQLLSLEMLLAASVQAEHA